MSAKERALSGIKQAAPSFLLFALTFLVLLQCSSCPLNSYLPGTDSSVFQYIGQQLLQGQIPYRDIFDHKGPLIYLINAFAFILSEKWGLWIVEFAFVFASALLWKKTLEVNGCSTFSSTFAAIVSLLFVSGNLQGGNLTEEYSLPFLSIPLFCVARGLNGKPRPFDCTLMGLSCTALLMLKFTSIAFLVPLLVVYFVKVGHKSAPRKIVEMFAGALTPFAVILFWLYFNDALEAFISDYIVFNITYAGAFDLIGKAESLLYFAEDLPLLLAFVAGVVALFSNCNPGNREIFLITNAAALFLGFVITAGTGYTYGHYALFFAPFLPLSVGFCLDKLREMKSPEGLACATVFAALLSYTSLIPYCNSTLDTMRGLSTSTSNKIEFLEELDGLTAAGDKIAIVGNECWIYLETGTTSASVHAYLPPQADQAWISGVLDSAFSSNSEAIIVDRYYGDVISIMNEQEGQYALVASTDALCVYLPYANA